MNTTSLLLLLLLVVIAWYWFNSLSAQGVARKLGRQAFEELDLQFLDDTVANIRLRLARGRYGRMVLRRSYRFEFSETGNSRREGHLIMLGDRLESMTMEPYQILA